MKKRWATRKAPGASILSARYSWPCNSNKHRVSPLRSCTIRNPTSLEAQRMTATVEKWTADNCPIVRAATDPDVQGGEYCGPGGIGRMSGPGYPKLLGSSGQSRDTGVQSRLWEISEPLSGVEFPV